MKANEEELRTRMRALVDAIAQANARSDRKVVEHMGVPAERVTVSLEQWQQICCIATDCNAALAGIWRVVP